MLRIAPTKRVEFYDIVIGLHCIFQDLEKIDTWLFTENLNLGGAAPIELIHKGKGAKVLKFINSQLDNDRPKI